MIWVIDASVAIRWLLKEEAHPHADSVLQKVIEHPEFFAVPELFCFEIYAVLCRLHPSPLDAFTKGIIPIVQGGLLRHPMTEGLAMNAFGFLKKGLTGYDACYAALAMELKGLWLTFDGKAHRRLAGEAVSHLLNKNLPKNW